MSTNLKVASELAWAATACLDHDGAEDLSRIGLYFPAGDSRGEVRWIAHGSKRSVALDERDMVATCMTVGAGDVALLIIIACDEVMPDRQFHARIERLRRSLEYLEIRLYGMLWSSGPQCLVQAFGRATTKV